MSRMALLLGALLMAGCGTKGSGPDPALRDLRSLDDLRSRFDADSGSPRLVLLMSPT